jgi:hypothetical protein
MRWLERVLDLDEALRALGEEWPEPYGGVR